MIHGGLRPVGPEVHDHNLQADTDSPQFFGRLAAARLRYQAAHPF
jgi:hypothetical protein